MVNDRPHVVIVGAGFGGLYAARALKHEDVRVTVVDRRNHHLFQPLLYQVATAGLSPSDIAYPIRAVLGRQKNAWVCMGEVLAIDVDAHKIILQDGKIEYDYLLIATGGRHSYSGHPEWEAYAPGLKNVEDALEIRRRILIAFEKAEREVDETRRQALLTFIIVGGGPTGVELAGAIAEIACMALVHDFRRINPQDARIILVEAGPRILPAFPEILSAKAEAGMRKLHVEVRTNSVLTMIRSGGVMIGHQSILAETVLWAAGVTASPLGRSLGVPLDRAGRVLVESDLSIPGHPEVLVVGDLAAFVDHEGAFLPGLAPVAIQQGRHAAQTIACRCKGQPSKPFHYVDRGILATVGRGSAVAHVGPIKISGFLAWVTWVFIHIFFLIGFRNRFIVLFEWGWAYITLQRSARLITGETEKNVSDFS